MHTVARRRRGSRSAGLRPPVRPTAPDAPCPPAIDSRPSRHFRRAGSGPSPRGERPTVPIAAGLREERERTVSPLKTPYTSDAEWLAPERPRWFTSGTVGGARPRRYHAVLLAAATPPTGRVAL